MGHNVGILHGEIDGCAVLLDCFHLLALVSRCPYDPPRFHPSMWVLILDIDKVSNVLGVDNNADCRTVCSKHTSWPLLTLLVRFFFFLYTEFVTTVFIKVIAQL